MPACNFKQSFTTALYQISAWTGKGYLSTFCRHGNLTEASCADVGHTHRRGHGRALPHVSLPPFYSNDSQGVRSRLVERVTSLAGHGAWKPALWKWNLHLIFHVSQQVWFHVCEFHLDSGMGFPVSQISSRSSVAGQKDLDPPWSWEHTFQVAWTVNRLGSTLPSSQGGCTWSQVPRRAVAAPCSGWKEDLRQCLWTAVSFAQPVGALRLPPPTTLLSFLPSGKSGEQGFPWN